MANPWSILARQNRHKQVHGVTTPPAGGISISAQQLFVEPRGFGGSYERGTGNDINDIDWQRAVFSNRITRRRLRNNALISVAPRA